MSKMNALYVVLLLPLYVATSQTEAPTSSHLIGPKFDGSWARIKSLTEVLLPNSLDYLQQLIKLQHELNLPKEQLADDLDFRPTIRQQIIRNVADRYSMLLSAMRWDDEGLLDERIYFPPNFTLYQIRVTPPPPRELFPSTIKIGHMYTPLIFLPICTMSSSHPVLSRPGTPASYMPSTDDHIIKK